MLVIPLSLRIHGTVLSIIFLHFPCFWNYIFISKESKIHYKNWKPCICLIWWFLDDKNKIFLNCFINYYQKVFISSLLIFFNLFSFWMCFINYNLKLLFIHTIKGISAADMHLFLRYPGLESHSLIQVQEKEQSWSKPDIVIPW